MKQFRFKILKNKKANLHGFAVDLNITCIREALPVLVGVEVFLFGRDGVVDKRNFLVFQLVIGDSDASVIVGLSGYFTHKECCDDEQQQQQGAQR
uniref:Uncharacterized protein n=1 Tax=Meloidogyne incognita TaxID=6306 RepID=A0A914NRJ7_MELIC